MNKYKLDIEQMADVELVIKQMWDDPDKFAFELVALRAENARLRAIFPKILEALGNGAGCTPDVSIEFLESIPQEIRLFFVGRGSQKIGKLPK